MAASDTQLKTYQHLRLWPETFAISKLPAKDELPQWHNDLGFSSITRTQEELSIVCEQKYVPLDVVSSRNWHMLQILGQMDFSLVGILSRIATPLATAGISIFAISTYDTDYILVQNKQLEMAMKVLVEEGYQIER